MAPNSSWEFPQWCWASCSVQPSGQNRVSCSGLLRSVSPWFWVSPRTDALQEAFRQAVPVHNHHHLWKGFSFLSGVSCVSMCACCLLSRHCKPQRKALTHILFSPHQVFIYVDKITLSFLFSSSALLAPSHMTAVASSPSPSSCPSAGLSPVVACLSCSGECGAERGTPGCSLTSAEQRWSTMYVLLLAVVFLMHSGWSWSLLCCPLEPHSIFWKDTFQSVSLC